MSGQMTNGEIEDVLASIRRLLRDDGTTDPAQGSAKSRARRLVLNPDSMVLDGAAASSPRAEVLVLTDPQPDLGPGRPGQDADGHDGVDDAEPSWNAPLVLSDPVVLPDRNPGIGTVADWGLDTPSGQPRSAGMVPGPSDDHADGPMTGKPSSLEERIAELEAALAREEAEWEADGGDPEVFASVRHLPFGEQTGGVAGDTDVAAADPSHFGAGVQSDADPAAPDGAESLFDDPGVPAPPRPRMTEDEVRAWIEAEALSAFGTTLGELVEEHGPEVADVTDEPGDEATVVTFGAEDGATVEFAEPSVALPPALEPDPMLEAHADALPRDAATDLHQANVDPASNIPAMSGTESDAPSLDTVDPVLAAEVRRIVSTVIRDELRGALGEQLTRSIRRLVRRELAQAQVFSQDK